MIKKIISAVVCIFALSAIAVNAQTTVTGNEVIFDNNADYRFAAMYNSDGTFTRIREFSEDECLTDYAYLARDIGGEGTVKFFSWNTELAPVADTIEKTVTVLDTKNFDTVSEDCKTLGFYNEESETVTKYTVADEVQMFVNNGETSWDEEDIQSYIADNVTGKVVLVDNDDDGRYDGVYVSYYMSANVNSINKNGNVFFESAESDFGLNIDLGGDINYLLTLDGKKIQPSELQANDVLSIAYDITNDFENSEFYDIIVSRKKVQGEITAQDTENCTYTIKDADYKYNEISMPFGCMDEPLGKNVIAFLDAFDRIVYIMEDNSVKNIAVLSNIYYDNSVDEYFVNLIKPDLSNETYQLKYSEDAQDVYGMIYSDGTIDAKGEKKEIQRRVVEYRVNQSNKIVYIGEMKYIYVSGMYNAEESTLGTLKISDVTKLAYVDANSDDNQLSDISLSSEVIYDAYAYNRYYDGTIPFILIVNDGELTDTD